MTPPQGRDGLLEPTSTDSVLILLQVPRPWRRLSEAQVLEALRYQSDEVLRMLAKEVKRWQGVGAIDLGPLRELLEEREAMGG